MGFLDGLGAGLGGLGALQSQQQAMLGQWQLAQTTAASTNVGNTYVVSAYPVEAAPAKPQGPETALEWLDRRVNEVRLPLAA